MLEHKFVENLPAILEPSILYVSMEYATAAHHCCCGCGEEIITPFTPTDWQMSYDGETISLHPSIGNWDFDCRSHYVIRRGRVIEAGSWSDAQIQKERSRDKNAKSQFYGIGDKSLQQRSSGTVESKVPNAHWWSRLFKYLKKWK